MTPEEIAAVSRISPELALCVVLATPLMGVLAWLLPGIQKWPVVRRLYLRWLGYDPGLPAEDDTSRRAMNLIDQLQEELEKCRALVDRYSAELEQLRLAKVGLLLHAGQLREAAIAARMMVHQLERRFGVPETEFDTLPGQDFPAGDTVSAKP